MTNLTKQHIGLQTIVTKSLNSKEQEVLAYISNPPTKFRDYQLKEKQELGVYLLAIAKFINISSLSLLVILIDLNLLQFKSTS